MIINANSISGLTTAFRADYNRGFKAVTPDYQKVATVIKSTNASNSYAWLGALRGIREFIGDRQLNNLAAHNYTIVNRTFEETVEVPATAIKDDQYGTYSPLMEQLGRNAAKFPDELVFGLAAAGNATACYDGQYFFSASHPVGDSTASNYDATGGGAMWILIDDSQALKPFIFQDREPFSMSQLNRNTDEHVFMRDQYVYGSYGRCNVGFGFWQMAYGSLNTLDSSALIAARAAMRGLTNDAGDPLHIRPTTLIVGPSNENAAEQAIKTVQVEGTTNTLYNRFDLIVSDYLT
jgi:phage major head subunit gpT-like protein